MKLFLFSLLHCILILIHASDLINVHSKQNNNETLYNKETNNISKIRKESRFVNNVSAKLMYKKKNSKILIYLICAGKNLHNFIILIYFASF